MSQSWRTMWAWAARCIFFILLNSIATVCQQMQKDMGIDGKSTEWANVVHVLLKMVEAELLEDDTAR